MAPMFFNAIMSHNVHHVLEGYLSSVDVRMKNFTATKAKATIAKATIAKAPTIEIKALVPG
jgi:hypothetical protein